MIYSVSLDQLRQQMAVPAVLALNAGTSFVVPGPTTIVVLGVAMPAFSLLFAVVGVGLGQLLAPAPVEPLGPRRRTALVIGLVMLSIGIVIWTGQQPAVAISWGIGLGFSGLPVVMSLGTAAKDGIKRVFDAFTEMVAARVGGKKGTDA